MSAGLVPYRILYLWRCLRNVSDIGAALSFLLNRKMPLPFATRVRFVIQIYRISLNIVCAHTEQEILQIATTVFMLPPTSRGCIIEAGCFKGGATAKLSIVAQLTNRTLYAFDSFEGLPANTENHGETIFGGIPDFEGGKYRGTDHEVRRSVTEYGAISSCRFVKGWFDQTMVGSSRVDLQACKLEYSIVSPK